MHEQIQEIVDDLKAAGSRLHALSACVSDEHGVKMMPPPVRVMRTKPRPLSCRAVISIRVCYGTGSMRCRRG